MLEDQTHSVNESLDTLLNWAKTQLSGIETNIVSFDPIPVVESNMALLQGQAAQKNIVFTTRGDTGLLIHADADQFNFIIRNLLSNAVKFSYENSTVEIEIARQNDEVLFRVKDRGVGISAERQKQFVTMHIGSTYGTSGEKGTGLGLLLIKEFVQANKGSITVESEEGKGTVFTVVFKSGGQ